MKIIKKIFIGLTLAILILIVIILALLAIEAKNPIVNYRTNSIIFELPNGWEQTSFNNINLISPNNAGGNESAISIMVNEERINDSSVMAMVCDYEEKAKAILKRIPWMNIISEQEKIISGFKGYEVKLQGKHEGVEIRGVLLLLCRDFKTYSIMFIASTENYIKDLPVFEKIIDSLKIDNLTKQSS